MGTPDLPTSARRIWPSGPMKGLQAHGNFQVDGPDWGINHPDTKISPPLFSTEKAIQAALTAAQRDEALSWNLLMYDDGSVSEQSLAIMQAAGSAVRKIYPKLEVWCPRRRNHAMRFGRTHDAALGRLSGFDQGRGECSMMHGSAA